MAKQVADSLRRDLPRNFAFEPKLTWAERPDPVALIYPYRWTAIKLAEGITLQGVVPDKASVAEVLRQARATNPGQQILDQMRVARGAPKPEQWREALGFALERVAELKAVTGERRRARIHDFRWKLKVYRITGN